MLIYDQQEKEKEEARLKKEKKENQKGKKPGFDGRWYTDVNKTKTRFVNNCQSHSLLVPADYVKHTM